MDHGPRTLALRASQGRVYRKSQLDERSLSWSLRRETEMKRDRTEMKKDRVREEMEMRREIHMRRDRDRDRDEER